MYSLSSLPFFALIKQGYFIIAEQSDCIIHINSYSNHFQKSKIKSSCKILLNHLSKILLN